VASGTSVAPLAIRQEYGSSVLPQERVATTRIKTETKPTMYTILNKQTAVINCDDLQTAIRFVQSLESGLDRLNSHSPYTIVKATDVPAAAGEADAHVSKAELYATQ